MMNRRLIALKVSIAVGLVMSVSSALAADFPALPLRRCAPDAVLAGTVCLDRLRRASGVPNPTTTNATLVRRIQLGKATETDLAADGAAQADMDGYRTPSIW